MSPVGRQTSPRLPALKLERQLDNRQNPSHYSHALGKTTRAERTNFRYLEGGGVFFGGTGQNFFGSRLVQKRLHVPVRAPQRL